MHIVLPAKSLTATLERVLPVTDPKATLPALANVKLDAAAGNLTITGSTLYQTITATVPTTACKLGGGVCLPAKALHERSRQIEGDIEIRVTDASRADLRAVSSKRRFDIPGLPATEYPAVDTVPSDRPHTLTAPPALLAMLLRRVLHAVALDETRPHVNSVLVEWWSDKRINCVATDGHRLSYTSASDTAITVAASGNALIQLLGATALQKLLEEAARASVQEVQIWHTPQSLHARIGSYTFSSKLVEAMFPPYQQVIPQDHNTITEIGRGALESACKAMTTTGALGGARIKFGPVIDLMAEDASEGLAEDHLETISHKSTGEPAEIGINTTYMLAALREMDAESITIGTSHDLDPVMMWTGDSWKGANAHLEVIMPMRAKPA